MKEIVLVDIPTCKISCPSSYKDIANKKYVLQKKIFDDVLTSERSVILPPPNYYSRALLIFAACLKEMKIDSVYVDWNDEKQRRKLDGLVKNAKIVIITCITESFPIAAEIARLVKEINESVKVIVGGRHATYYHSEILEDNNFDIVIRGEGEESLPETVDALLRSSPLEKIKGITYKREGKIFMNPSASPIEYFDRFPLPLYEILPKHLDNYHHNLISTRGCTFRCKFCQEPFFWNGKVRGASPERFVEELSYLAEHVKDGTMIHISDSIFNSTNERALEICKLIKKSGISLRFSGDIRAGFIDRETINYMHDAGFVQVGIGIEDASASVLKTIDKRTSFDIAAKTCKMIKDTNDIFINGYWLTGLPGSTNETFSENIKGLQYLYRKKLLDIVSNKILVPYPGIPFFDKPEKYGIKILHKNWINYERMINPVYRLENLSEKDIYEQFLKMESELVRLYQERTGLTNEDISKLINGNKFTTWSYVTECFNQGKQTII